MRIWSFFAFFPIGFLLLTAPVHAGAKVTVFAASSTKPVFDALAPLFEQHAITLSTVHAGSSTLARQIEQGAPADIYVSANVRWMDYLSDRGWIIAATKRIVASNRLVLISGPTALRAPKMMFGEGYPLAAVLGDERLAIADPDHVPAGIYGREALTNLKLWPQVQDKLARTLDVTSALMMVARSQAPLGIVYASDVGRTNAVKIFAHFPKSSHGPITYPAAIVKGHDRAAVRKVMKLLSGAEGHAAFNAAGFEALP